MDFNLKVLDNGDESIIVKTFFNPSKILQVYSKQFIPVMEPCRFILAGKGFLFSKLHI